MKKASGFLAATKSKGRNRSSRGEVRKVSEGKIEVGPTWKSMTAPSDVGVEELWFAVETKDAGVKERWFAPETKDTDWVSLRCDRTGSDFIGYAWYRAWVKVPREFARHKNLLLVFGAVDGDADVYINGKKAFEHTWNSTGLIPSEIWKTPFAFHAGPYLILDAENLIAVRVYNRVAKGGIWQPVYVISTDADEPQSVYQEGFQHARRRKLFRVDWRKILPPRTQDEWCVPRRQRQLFLDDYGIARTSNLTRTMHSPAKKGAVIRAASGQIRTAPMWIPQENVFKLLVSGTMWASPDGLHWHKTVTPNDANCPQELVLYHPSDPDPNCRYKGFIHADPASSDLTPVVSSDGVTWKRLDVPPISSGDEYNLSYDDVEKLFILIVKHFGPYERTMWLTISRDFRHWTVPELMFHADKLDQKLGKNIIRVRLADPHLQHPISNDPKKYKVDIYNMGVFRYEGLYIGMPSVFHATGPDKLGTNLDGFHIIQLTGSRDLRHWQRLGDRQPFIGPSPRGAGAYDLTELICPSAPVYMGDEMWFYYTGIKYREIPEGAEPDRAAVCLATLRRDGFVSLDAGDQEGWVRTKLFILHGGTLHLNAKVSGRLVVQVQDEAGNPLAGLERSEPVRGDQLDATVKWVTGDLKRAASRTVQLHFEMTQGQLYSFWIE